MLASRSLPRPWERLLESLAEAVRQHYGPRLTTLAVFGSVGRGTPTPESDIDFLIIADNLPDGRMARVAEFDPVERRWEESVRPHLPPGRAVLLSPVFKTPREAAAGSPLFLDMVEDARMLADRDGFFQGILERMRARMRANGARRVWRGKAWYWILKPGKAPGEAVPLL